MEQEFNYFKVLSSINLSDKIKKKDKLSYVSWAWAWGELKKRFPDATYKIYERDQEIITTQVDHYDKKEMDIANAIPESPQSEVTIVKKTVIPINYFTDGRTAWVKVGVTVQGIEHIEELPIMNNRNQAILAGEVTSTQVNKAIQRALTKAIARHGVGLYVYAGEDLPEDSNDAAAVDENSLEENKLATLQSEVANLIIKYVGSDYEGEVDSYIREHFGDVRISQTTTSHIPQLLAAKEYLTALGE